MTDRIHSMLPDPASIDYSDGLEVGAYNHLLMALLQLTDRFCGLEPSIGPSEPYIHRALDFIGNVEENVDRIPSCQLFQALAMFDLTKRAVCRRPAGELLRRAYTRAFDDRQRGDSSISDARLFAAVSSALPLFDHKTADRMRRWLAFTLRRWCANGVFSRPCNPIPLHESILRVDRMLLSDLSAFTPDQESVKKRILAGIIPLFSSLPDHDADTLSALMLLFSNHRRILRQHLDSEDVATKIHAILSLHPGAHPLERAACRLQLSLSPVSSFPPPL